MQMRRRSEAFGWSVFGRQVSAGNNYESACFLAGGPPIGWWRMGRLWHKHFKRRLCMLFGDMVRKVSLLKFFNCLMCSSKASLIRYVGGRGVTH